MSFSEAAAREGSAGTYNEAALWREKGETLSQDTRHQTRFLTLTQFPANSTPGPPPPLHTRDFWSSSFKSEMTLTLVIGLPDTPLVRCFTVGNGTEGVSAFSSFSLLFMPLQ